MKNYAYLLNSNARAELARRNLLDFVLYTKSNYLANWHHELLCSYLDKFVRGEIRRLMVFMPPQHGKSELVSRNLPAFLLGKNPKSKIILASYSSNLASSFNRDCQRIMDSQAYHDVFPETNLSSSNVVTVAGNWLRNSEIFETVGHGGFLKTVGVGGSLTGTPADYAIIDDPVKDSIEATSATYQQRNWDWYNDVLSTRLHNGSSVLITQTRWDTRDLSGMLLTAMEKGSGIEWTILNLPAINEAGPSHYDPREAGDALWPERHSKERLLQIQGQSIRTFQALYQQNPRPVETGGEFYKQFRIGLHVKDDIVYDPQKALHITFDFNVNPYMTCCIWQMSGKVAVQIDELCLTSPRNTTKAICKEITRKYQGHEAGLFIYGDPAGKHEDTRAEKGYNDYTIIMSELKDMKPSKRVASSAPAVVMRGNFLNTVFESNYEGIEIYISRKCAKTIEDYSYLKEDSDGTKLKEKGKNPETGATYERYGHTSDANDYFLCYVFSSEYDKYKRGGVAPKITLGKNPVSKHGY